MIDISGNLATFYRKSLMLSLASPFAYLVGLKVSFSAASVVLCTVFSLNLIFAYHDLIAKKVPMKLNPRSVFALLLALMMTFMSLRTHWRSDQLVVDALSLVKVSAVTSGLLAVAFMIAVLGLFGNEKNHGMEA